MIVQLTVAGAPLSVAVLPASPGMRTVEWTAEDAVAVNRSPFTGFTQTSVWPGADARHGTMTLPMLEETQAREWRAFLLSLRGMVMPFLLGDPLCQAPAGQLQGSVPLIDNAAVGGASPVYQAGMTTLAVKGLTPGKQGILLPGDVVQVGYRMHDNLQLVNADGNGKAVLSLWPSLREVPVDGAKLVLANPAGALGLSRSCGPVGLFRRANNKQPWSKDATTRLTSLSFQVEEYR